MHDNPSLRVIGVDGKLGVQITSAINQMCAAGWIQGDACTNPKVTYETTDNGYGWYHFHHHPRDLLGLRRQEWLSMTFPDCPP